MTNKGKSRNVINEYDHSWLLSLYHWLRLEKTRVIHLNATPEFCRYKIDTLITRSKRFNGVQTRETPYEFRVSVNESEDSQTGAGIVIGRVIAEVDGTSTVILRAYPVNSSVGCVSFIIVPVLYGTLYLMAQDVLTNPLVVIIYGGMFSLILLFLIWIILFRQHTGALNFLSHALEPLADHELEKAKNTPDDGIEIEDLMRVKEASKK